MQVRRDQVFVRRRRLVAAVLVGVLAGSLASCMTTGGDDDPTGTAGRSSTTDPATGAGPATDGGDATDEGSGTEATSGADETSGDDETTSDEPTETAEAAPEPPPIPSDTSHMDRVDYLTGGITPKSVVASGHGLVIANNMMYSHTSTVYDATTRTLDTTLSDSIKLSDFGIKGHPGTSQGAPVEAAWTADGKFAYVSQYTMYGSGFGRSGFDDCSPSSGVGRSYLYRFNADLMDWDQVIEVGAVPKYVDITPDQTRVLVSNWCDSTVSVVDIAKAKQVEVIPVDSAPRGIEVMPDNRTAYVAAMYADELFKLDLDKGTSELMMRTERKPRHLNLSEDGKYLYMAVSGADTIYKIDTDTETIVDQVHSGREPRSMAMSSDGTALYVVNYYESTVAKIRTSDMTVIDKQPTDANPIGVTYEPLTHTVWVACYGGSIYVFDDTVPGIDS